MKKLLVLFLLFALTVVPMGAMAQAPDASLIGGDLVIGMNGTPYALNGWSSNDMNANLLADLLYPSLIKYDENANKVPYVLTSYEHNEDATVWTAKVMEGIYWHDGEKFTAEDLAFTANYCATHDVNFGSDYYRMVKEAVALDELTVQYTLNESYVNFINNAGYWVDVMPKHLIENVEDFTTFQVPTIGYGAYKLDNYVDGEYYTFTRVENSPLGGYANTITYRVFADANAMTLALMSGEIDCTASSLPVSAQEQLNAQPDNYGMEQVQSLGYGYFGFSYANPLLADKAVRTAIAQTIDRNALVAIGIQGGGTVMNTPISPIYQSMVEGAAQFPAFDLEAAKATLEAAGYVDNDGDGIRENANGDKLSFSLTCRNTTANIDSIANIFKANCAEAGVEIVLNIIDPPTYTDLVIKQMTFDINYIEWGVVDDPDTMLDAIYLSTATLNFMQYKNEAIDEILNTVKYVMDMDTRIERMKEFQALFVEELPTVNVLVRLNCYGYSKQKWEGFSATPGLYGVADAKDIVNVHLIK